MYTTFLPYNSKRQADKMYDQHIARSESPLYASDSS